MIPPDISGGSRLDTSNRFLVTRRAADGKIMLAALPAFPSITRKEAAVFAAWLYVLSDDQAVFERTVYDIRRGK